MSRKHARRYKDALYKFTAILLTVLMALPQNGMTAMANTASSATTGSEAAVQVLDKSASDSTTSTSTDESSSTASEAVSSSDQSSSVADSATATPVTSDSATSDSTDAQPVTTEAATPEATAEEAPATPSMPAQSFNGSASNGVSVTATADEGAFPEGTTMSVATVNSETAIDKAQAVVEGNVVDALAVDITFQDADGNEIQPTDPALVHVQLNTSEAVEGDSFQVVHVEDNGSASVVSDDKVESVSNDEASFESEGFSVYAIIGTKDGINKETARDTYNFVLDDGTTAYTFTNTAGKSVSYQIVKTGNTLVEPATPTKASTTDAAGNAVYYEFLGWYKADGTKFDFSQAITTGTTDSSITLTAKFQAYVYVNFYDEASGTTQNVLTSKKVVLTDGKSASVTLDDVTATSTDSNKKFVGWNTDAKAATGLTSPLTVTGSINLYPVFDTGYWITFNTGDQGNGASFVSPVQYLATYTLKSDDAPAPTRTGYTFAGWYTDKDCTSPFGWDHALTGDITLYAKWTASDTQYSVVIWKQNVTGKSYDYEKTYSLKASTGSTVSVDGQYKSESYTGFHYSTCDDSKTVSADGTTVLNVYYNRDTVTITFWIRSGWSDGWTKYKTMTGLYGSTLAANKYTWPTEYAWHEGSERGTHLTFLDSFILPDESAANLYGSDNGSGATINHYKQNVDGTWPTTAANSITSDSGKFYFSNKYDGFTVSQYQTSDGDSWNDCTVGDSAVYGTMLNIRYTRNNYRLDLKDSIGNALLSSQQIAYEAAIADPSTPAVSHEGYTFSGWYLNPECTNKVDFKTLTMPANNLVLYAGWTKNQYKVTLNANDGILPSGQDASFTVKYGDTISESTPTREGYTFIGWYNGDSSYNFATPVTSDVTLTAHWKKNGSYSVSYSTQGAKTTLEDSATYSDGATVVLPASLDSDHIPSGKRLSGWTYNGDSYGPGATITLDASKATDGVVTITANYVDDTIGVTNIQFDANGGSGTV